MLLNVAKASPDALLNAAEKLIDKEQYFDAEIYLKEMLKREPANPEALFLMAKNYGLQKIVRPALDHYIAAMKADPSSILYKQGFIDFLSDKASSTQAQAVDDALIDCFRHGKDLNLVVIQYFWLTHIVSKPEYRQSLGFDQMKPYDPEGNRAVLQKITNFEPVFRPIFLLAIKNMTIFNPIFEEFITYLRACLLEKKFDNEQSLMLADALSPYSFRTDFILDTTEDEQKKVDDLGARIGSGKADVFDIAVYSCYEPLYKLENADDIMRKFAGIPALSDIIATQIADYRALRETADAVMAITPIENSTSQEVRGQYEEFPYPRWTAFSLEGMDREWQSRAGDPAIAALQQKKARILNAGCGTGQEATMLATLFPKAEILAVDLSRTSLAYAIRRTKECGISNITFRQADILNLGSLNQKFDYISSAGVLHHMKDPMAGWKMLCDLLKPGGFMSIGLYSKTARRHVLRAQAIAKEAGYPGTAAGMKAFRRNALQLLGVETLDSVSRMSDYYSLSMYRDLLFHVQEYDYEIPELAAIFKELNLEFVGFSYRRDMQEGYLRRFPDDPSLTNLANWHIYEQENPSAFIAMYIFWCRKKKAQ